MNEEIMIVTFGCSNSIHLFEKNGGRRPFFPYQIHKTIDDAITHLGIQDAKIIRY
jgi:hypothetical protein